MREERTSSALPSTSGGKGLSPAERSLRARLAAHAMHGKHDARATTAKAPSSVPRQIRATGRSRGASATC